MQLSAFGKKLGEDVINQSLGKSTTSNIKGAISQLKHAGGPLIGSLIAISME